MQNGYKQIMWRKKMQLLAKPVLEDKFWIVERDGEKVGTIRNNELGVTFTVGKDNKRFETVEDVLQTYSIQFGDKQDSVAESQEFEVHGFACKTKPYNAVMDLKRKLPLYTKTENSQSFFCAGYYVVHWEDGSHSPSYCPKLITLQRYEYEGPFKTRIEMQEVLRKS